MRRLDAHHQMAYVPPALEADWVEYSTKEHDVTGDG